MEIEIDYSNLPPEPVGKNLEEEWEPPRHVYFGKRDERGRMEKEPSYSHQEYPRLMYAKNGEKITAKIIYNDEQLLALGDGWEKTPAVFGYVSAPSFEETLAVKETPVKRGRKPAQETL